MVFLLLRLRFWESWWSWLSWLQFWFFSLRLLWCSGRSALFILKVFWGCTLRPRYVSSRGSYKSKPRKRKVHPIRGIAHHYNDHHCGYDYHHHVIIIIIIFLLFQPLSSTPSREVISSTAACLWWCCCAFSFSLPPRVVSSSESDQSTQYMAPWGKRLLLGYGVNL